MMFKWKSEYEVGIQLIDEQHKNNVLCIKVKG
jgi:hemerythrin